MFGFFKDKFENLKNAVSNTAQNLVGNVLSNVDTSEEEYSEFALDDIEDTLISADLGVNYAAELVDNLRAKKNAKPSELKNYLMQLVRSCKMSPYPICRKDNEPFCFHAPEKRHSDEFHHLLPSH